MECGWPSVNAQVPGNVELDLVAAGVLEEPSVGERIYQLRPFEAYDWWYDRTFDSPSVAPGERVELVFDGLDCLATLWLNGRLIGSADNMLIGHRLDVTGDLRQDGPNHLWVRLESAVLAARKHSVAPSEHASATNFEALRVRKAPHMYGWDILPRLVSAGIWRGVRLEVLSPTRWRDVYFATAAVDPRQRTARALLAWNFQSDLPETDALTVRTTLQRGGKIVFEHSELAFSTHGRRWLDLQDVRFWWPRGYGDPELYDLRLELVDDRRIVLDIWSARVGIRKVELERTDLTSPSGEGQFLFRVNGEPVFVKGTNWVPLDALHSRDSQHLNAAVAMLVDLNCNMVRCWGGNVYEDHAFFDLCDRHGVMVWQDFAMACAVYPQDDQFAQQIEREAASVVSKLRNHPSLVIWAGNNEVDEAYEWARTGINPNTDRLTREVLPGVIRRLDPLRPFLPSSPYRPEAFFRQQRPASQALPEQHLWGPRNDFKGSTYTDTAAHFASEIGYHGCPEVASLRQFIEPRYLWPWQDNPQWLAHAVRPHPSMKRFDDRIPLMARQIRVLFEHVPENLDDFVLASQISQAEALKFFVEWFRQGKWRRTGILWWNLRDGWPVISDAVVDYYGRKKLAYGYIKRAQADACAICAEPSDGRHNLVVTNDSLRAIAGRVAVRDFDGGAVLLEQRFTVPANALDVAGTLPQSPHPAFWLIDWTLDDGTRGSNHYLAGSRPFALADYKRWLRAVT